MWMRNWMPAMRIIGSDQLMIESRSVLNLAPAGAQVGKIVGQALCLPTSEQASDALALQLDMTSE
jgi:hypothetical protein